MEYVIWFWRTYPVAVDLALYFFVFGAAARVAFVKIFPGHEGKVLSVAVGLFLAAGLAMAQRTMGFSTEKMGPVAGLVLCGIVLIASYRFMHRAETPRTLAILLSLLLAVALARTVMPGATERFLRNNPFVVVLALGGMIFWAWQKSEGLAKRVDNRKPGNQLALNGIVPSETKLKAEKTFVKKRMRRDTRKTLKEEQKEEKEVDGSIEKIEQGNMDKEEREKVLRVLARAQDRARRVREYCDRLARLDQALQRYDWKWLKKEYGVSFGDFTPEQQRVLKKTIIDERKRLRTEEALQKLVQEVDTHAREMENSVSKARECLKLGNGAGAAAWLVKALEADRLSEKLERRILEAEKWLLTLLRRQRRDLVKVDIVPNGGRSL